jgi:hypothetical protein
MSSAHAGRTVDLVTAAIPSEVSDRWVRRPRLRIGGLSLNQAEAASIRPRAPKLQAAAGVTSPTPSRAPGDTYQVSRQAAARVPRRKKCSKSEQWMEVRSDTILAGAEISNGSLLGTGSIKHKIRRNPLGFVAGGVCFIISIVLQLCVSALAAQLGPQKSGLFEEVVISRDDAFLPRRLGRLGRTWPDAGH